MITIDVSGTSNSGKTTISAVIANALNKHGFDTTVNLTDIESINEINNLNERVKCIVNKNNKITINEVQMLRSC